MDTRPLTVTTPVNLGPPHPLLTALLTALSITIVVLIVVATFTSPS